MTTPEITIYGTTWCPDVRRARRFFDERKIPYNWVDIDVDQDGRKFVEQKNNGKRSVPTIVFLDGSILVEPSTSQLAAKLS